MKTEEQQKKKQKQRQKNQKRNISKTFGKRYTNNNNDICYNIIQILRSETYKRKRKRDNSEPTKERNDRVVTICAQVCVGVPVCMQTYSV